MASAGTKDFSDTARNAMELDCAPTHTLNIVSRHLDELLADSNNPRLHNNKQIRQIAASIRSFGFNVPILVDANAKVIAGHGRLAACKLLDIKTVKFTLDASYMQNNTVAEWPSALLFIYSGWSSAELAVDSNPAELTLQNQGKPTHLEFRVQPSSASTSSCDTTGQTTTDAQHYFAELMSLLDFQGKAAPTIVVPGCVNGHNPIQVRRGDDANLGCEELGLGASCTDGNWHEFNMDHGPLSAKGQVTALVQLVNCASGHGGVGGGCC